MFTQDDNQLTANSATQDVAQDTTESTTQEVAREKPAQDDYVSSYQPPAQQAQETQQDSVGPDQPVESVQSSSTTQSIQADEESFVPPQESLVESTQPVSPVQPPQDSSQMSASDGSNDNADLISDKLEELEKLVESFEKENDQVHNNQTQSQKTLSKVEIASNVKHQLNQEDTMGNPQDNTQNTQDGGANEVFDKETTSYQADQQSTPPSTTQQPQQIESETLADQNIFFLLGAQDGSTQEQEQFLDELQQVIWEDLLKSDLDLLITSQEKEKVDQILQDSNLDEIAKQEQILEYLDGLIPDLEEIMLEKALKLKQELVQERVASLRETLAQDQEKMAKLDEVDQLLAQDKWYSAGVLLNQIS
ncbi:MAG: hypothetical protein XD95_0064 [Microgenomates bacterium 39_7]|nr:MAG: hypothetical protein XD95_0064 [Microgenomates bacterium 39_7]